jgi:hypothetical protein
MKKTLPALRKVLAGMGQKATTSHRKNYKDFCAGVVSAWIIPGGEDTVINLGLAYAETMAGGASYDQMIEANRKAVDKAAEALIDFHPRVHVDFFVARGNFVTYSCASGQLIVDPV